MLQVAGAGKPRSGSSLPPLAPPDQAVAPSRDRPAPDLRASCQTPPACGCRRCVGYLQSHYGNTCPASPIGVPSCEESVAATAPLASAIRGEQRSCWGKAGIPSARRAPTAQQARRQAAAAWPPSDRRALGLDSPGGLHALSASRHRNASRPRASGASHASAERASATRRRPGPPRPRLPGGSRRRRHQRFGCCWSATGASRRSAGGGRRRRLARRAQVRRRPVARRRDRLVRRLQQRQAGTGARLAGASDLERGSNTRTASAASRPTHRCPTHR